MSAGVAVFAQIPNHTGVVIPGLATALVVASEAAVCAEVGTAAKVTDDGAVLLLAVVGPLPKLARLSTRYPHVFAASAVGLACVPDVGGIKAALLPVRLLLDVLLFIESEYPVGESVVTTTESFWVVHVVLEPGVTFIFTTESLVTVMPQVLYVQAPYAPAP